MQIGIIVNPKSGRNKAQTLAQRCQSLLADHSHKVLTVETGQLGMSDEIWESDRLIIIGGDGTVHHALPKLIKHQIPFYHLGTGTSNLISKELGMPQKPAVAVEWV
ncbi:MAG: acylglycerol kinase family protein, partial [Phycisphaerales bacterium]|nr:acylglycerol kinase family protein [Phycisphaerales bacterium]